MILEEKLLVLKEGIYYLINIIDKMNLADDLPELYMFLLGERTALYKKIDELKGGKDGDPGISDR